MNLTWQWGLLFMTISTGGSMFAIDRWWSVVVLDGTFYVANIPCEPLSTYQQNLTVSCLLASTARFVMGLNWMWYTKYPDIFLISYLSLKNNPFHQILNIHNIFVVFSLFYHQPSRVRSVGTNSSEDNNWYRKKAYLLEFITPRHVTFLWKWTRWFFWCVAFKWYDSFLLWWG